MLPYTQAEWRKTIGEVKRKYFGKRYRACSARCLEVLDGIKDTSQVEPVYLIYLHFYAATSLEICARPLPSTAALRSSLLQQARTHFDRASALINAAEDSVLRKFRPGSAGSSRGSSCHSPSGSVSSRAWTPDTRVSSPTDSLCSFDDLSLKPPQSPPKRVKKVSFSLPKETSFHMEAEPFIRPDSPTLGFDDFFQPSAAAAAAAMQQQEELAVLAGSTPKFHEIELPLQTIAEHVDAEEQEQQQHGEYDEPEPETAYQTARSIDRCCEHLSSLRTQLARHSTSLDQLLSLAAAPPLQSPKSSSSSPTTESVAMARGEAARAADRQARIERLRKINWQRKRFDASRYEELCEAVLAELA
jgi:hypothetical protein